MHIIPARLQDEAAIKQLLDSADLPTDDITAKSLQHFLVLHVGGRLAGVVGLDPDGEVGLLRSLAVDPTMRKRGIGNRLVDAAEALAARRGVRAIYLLTTTADRYFAARDYQPMAREKAPPAIASMPQFKSLCPASSTLMMKPL